MQKMKMMGGKNRPEIESERTIYLEWTQQMCGKTANCEEKKKKREQCVNEGKLERLNLDVFVADR